MNRTFDSTNGISLKISFTAPLREIKRITETFRNVMWDKISMAGNVPSTSGEILKINGRVRQRTA